MTLQERKYSFIELGKFLKQFANHESEFSKEILHNELFFNDFKELIHLSQSHNGWFTPDNVYFAIQSWADALTESNLEEWLSKYDLENVTSKTIALVLAGNIPLVGFHDFISVLLTGHKVLVKSSSNDQFLISFLAKYLVQITPEFKNYISFVKDKLESFDAVIATGSNNTARYFEYYFKNKPSIIRKSRNSVAILDGKESEQNLIALGEDIFRYFGLGCRNVSKLFVPRNYNFDAFFNGMFPYNEVIQYEKYANNYDYNKAVFLMSNFKLLDNGFLVIKEEASHASPISSVFYEFYDDIKVLEKKLELEKEKIQCIVSNNLINNSIPFGESQKPKLWDYADEVDTIEFLSYL